MCFLLGVYILLNKPDLSLLLTSIALLSYLPDLIELRVGLLVFVGSVHQVVKAAHGASQDAAHYMNRRRART